uniref:Developmental pluripotency associated 3 n=1 Tax=Gorilla gorilla gorilla TaxID=9595 RepID=A0A2I2Z4G6_GORGO
MDPSKKFNPTYIPESPQMLTEENSRDDSGASQICSETSESVSPLSEALLRRESVGAAVLREIEDEWLYSRRGVRTLMSVQREKMARLRYMLLGRVRMHERRPTNKEPKGVKKESRPFKCPCSFCNARIENQDTKPLQP